MPRQPPKAFERWRRARSIAAQTFASKVVACFDPHARVRLKPSRSTANADRGAPTFPLSLELPSASSSLAGSMASVPRYMAIAAHRSMAAGFGREDHRAAANVSVVHDVVEHVGGAVGASEPAYYNCIAFVVDDFRRKWWPGEYHPLRSGDFWPLPVEDDNDTLKTFVAGLATVGYELCADGAEQVGIEKIALYARGTVITHAALQLPGGTWKSKLAGDEDIEHTLPGLEGPCYGAVVAFMKRPRAPSAQAEPAG